MNNTELIALCKESLSIISTATLKDGEIQMWIDAAKEDLKRQGILQNTSNALIKSAIVMYVKSHFGNVDIKEKELSQKTYNLLCSNLGLSADYKVVENDA